MSILKFCATSGFQNVAPIVPHVLYYCVALNFPTLSHTFDDFAAGILWHSCPKNKTFLKVHFFDPLLVNKCCCFLLVKWSSIIHVQDQPKKNWIWATSSKKLLNLRQHPLQWIPIFPFGIHLNYKTMGCFINFFLRHSGKN